MYDTANHDERRAILQQFIKEIRVRKDYEISITLNASFNQVEQLKSVSTYDGAEIFEEISEKGAYRPSLGGCVWMPDGSSELSGFQKRRRLKHTASRRWTNWARRFWWGGTMPALAAMRPTASWKCSLTSISTTPAWSIFTPTPKN